MEAYTKYPSRNVNVALPESNRFFNALKPGWNIYFVEMCQYGTRMNFDM
jgi:hypothetical protein